MVLPLEADGVGDGSLARRFPNHLLRDTPSTVLGGPRNFTLLVRQFLRRAKVIALIPRQTVDRRRRRWRAPQRVFVLPVVVAVFGWSSSSMASCRTACATGTKLPGSRGARAKAILVGDLAFPRERVAVPAIQREAALQLAVALHPLGAIPVRAGFPSLLVVGLAVLRQAPAEGVVAVVRLQALVFVVREPVEQVPGETAFLSVLPAFCLSVPRCCRRGEWRRAGPRRSDSG